MPQVNMMALTVWAVLCFSKRSPVSGLTPLLARTMAKFARDSADTLMEQILVYSSMLVSTFVWMTFLLFSRYAMARLRSQVAISEL